MRDEIRSLVMDCYVRAMQERNAALGIATDIAPPSEATLLFGTNAELDSLALVVLVLNLEELLADRLNIEITIMDEKAMSQGRSPFRTIGALTDYVVDLAQQ